ncbi:iron-sulfur cluster assembly scaffold protein [Borrelia sp. BU AG58]|uniref:iron-sulfur cluster assembly scaffold protein n=1 Tax=Borrelia sp. BU AG58 TaxID=2887345 RepID=UPI001E29789F|nr:iron-sulfur cluster assembly scaffold protein [Borrelia sp. BU AG58]UER67296.1 iron-sulfur cluster assembly scaffold protein [Borrelia sp. BU AG58]
MLSEKIKKELIRLSRISTYTFKTDEDQNLVYQSKCGDQIAFQINVKNGKIRLKYNASGCVVLLASAYTLTRICDNKSEEKMLEVITKTINKNFEKLEEIDASLKNFENFIHTNRQDCFMLPYKALNESLNTMK